MVVLGLEPFVASSLHAAEQLPPLFQGGGEFAGLKVGDAKKRGGFQAVAADERAIEVGLAHERVGVLFLPGLGDLASP